MPGPANSRHKSVIPTGAEWRDLVFSNDRSSPLSILLMLFIFWDITLDVIFVRRLEMTGCHRRTPHPHFQGHLLSYLLTPTPAAPTETVPFALCATLWHVSVQVFGPWL